MRSASSSVSEVCTATIGAHVSWQMTRIFHCTVVRAAGVSRRQVGGRRRGQARSGKRSRPAQGDALQGTLLSRMGNAATLTHKNRRVETKLKRRATQPAGPLERFTDRNRAGESVESNARIVQEGISHTIAGADDQVQPARWQPGIGQDSAELSCHNRSVGSRLEYDSIASSQRGSNLVRYHVDRKVKWSDGAYNPNRNANGESQPVLRAGGGFQRYHFSVNALCFLCRPGEGICCPFGLGQRVS